MGCFYSPCMCDYLKLSISRALAKTVLSRGLLNFCIFKIDDKNTMPMFMWSALQVSYGYIIFHDKPDQSCSEVAGKLDM